MRVPRLLFFLAIFFSAFLLFQVQPLIAKIILPWFGGSAAVWIVCLLFFQVVLLLGYLYAHFLTEVVPLRLQRWVHAAVVVTSFIALEMPPKHLWIPDGPEAPVRHILRLLSVTVGLPYFLLASTSPLLQSWYSRAQPGTAPYRLYALSNLGSMLALLSYPVIVEPFLSTSHQADGWSIAFAGVAILCATVGFLATGLRTDDAHARDESIAGPDWKTQVLWMALAAGGSALLLSVTDHITQNVAAVPFLWIAPLSLYLLSFIVCFDAEGWYRRGLFLRLLGVLLGGMAYALSPSFASLPVKVLIPLFCAGLFVCCMFCHGELARLKPDPVHLTRFYLMISAGGAVGAIFVALLAPRIFSGYYELHVALGVCAVLVLAVHAHDPESDFRRTRWQPSWLVMIGLVVALLASLFSSAREQVTEARLTVRNFYGVLRIIGGDGPSVVVVKDQTSDSLAEDARYIRLVNGTIDHGLQFFAWSRRRWPTTYYGPSSGIGVALGAARGVTPLRVGVIGLGAGTIAAYGQTGDRFTFYEINPLDVQIARTQFTYLRESQAAIDIVMGDARLSLERQSPQDFDVLAVDAFSGDSIPVHLLTRQAFELYFRHLKPGGILAVHISNKYLDLEPIVASAAAWFNKEAVMISNPDDHQKGIYAATWILLGNRTGFTGQPQSESAGTILAPAGTRKLWTDDYSSLLEVLR
jgi:SAM-dependent methyltransferase